MLVGIWESNKTPVTPCTSNTPSSPKGLKSFDPGEDQQLWGRNWWKLERYINAQSQGLHRELIPLSEMASDELLWEAE